MGTLRGYLATVTAFARRVARPPTAPPSSRWTTSLVDPRVGRIAVSGRLAVPGGESWPSGALAVLLHGLGGSADSPYLARAAAAAHELGIASLRLNLRGADPAAGDFYHAGLTAELHAVAGAATFQRVERIFVLGYSLGGHVALRYATEVDDPRVGAAAAICSPLDLAAASRHFETLACLPFRGYVLRRLKRMYRALDYSRPQPVPYARVRRVRSLREWDALTVCPRFDFRDPADYYARASVGPLLDRLRIRSLLVASRHDPIVPPAAIRRWLPEAASAGVESADSTDRLTVRWPPASGHVAFPPQVDLGLDYRSDLESQVLRWLYRPAAPGAPGRPAP